MGNAHGFEDLRIWQAARELVRSVYRLTNKQKFHKDSAMRDQLRRAAVSSMPNIAEGFERGSKREFVRFLYMAKGSSGEIRSHLYVARDLNYITSSEFEQVGGQAVALSKGVFRFIQHLESSGQDGEQTQ